MDNRRQKHSRQVDHQLVLQSMTLKRQTAKTGHPDMMEVNLAQDLALLLKCQTVVTKNLSTTMAT